MFESQLRRVSVGIAAENKQLSSRELRVVPIEIIPMVDGELVDALEEFDVSGQDRQEKEYNVRVSASNTITATWLPFGSNRVTPPDIRRGERLDLYQMADHDKYYWAPMGLDDELRRLETVIYAWSATKEENVELQPGKNMYSLEISTHGKHITLATTDVDEEATTYKLQLNTGDGSFFLVDKQGNQITINSTENQIEARTGDDCKALLDKKDLELTVPGNAKGDVEGNTTINIGKNLDVTIDGEAALKVGKNLDATIDGAVTLNVAKDVDATVQGNLTANVTGNCQLTATGSLKGSAMGGVMITDGIGGIKMANGMVDIN